MTAIAEGLVVSIQYTLRNERGKVLDVSEDGHPLIYLHGAENIVSGLESQLAGLEVGATCMAVVPPADGYGDRNDESDPQPIPSSEFPADMPLEPGIGFAVEGAEGQMMSLWVDRIEGDKVFVDTNHPLAGETLHFEVEVVAIREATDDERTHGHPHGPTGHEGHEGHGH
jgi:FKBP-type peptidyl-prolyl cis-trans isomerase SlyD